MGDLDLVDRSHLLVVVLHMRSARLTLEAGVRATLSNMPHAGTLLHDESIQVRLLSEFGNVVGARRTGPESRLDNRTWPGGAIQGDLKMQSRQSRFQKKKTWLSDGKRLLLLMIGLALKILDIRKELGFGAISPMGWA